MLTPNEMFLYIYPAQLFIYLNVNKHKTEHSISESLLLNLGPWFGLYKTYNSEHSNNTGNNANTLYIRSIKIHKQHSNSVTWITVKMNALSKISYWLHLVLLHWVIEGVEGQFFFKTENRILKRSTGRSHWRKRSLRFSSTFIFLLTSLVKMWYRLKQF